MKRHLFGSEISLYKMRCDHLIPPQHYFQLYLKAARSESQLDEFYNRSQTYLTELIKRSKNQINLLEAIIRHPRKSLKYEKLNFTRYYSRLNEDMKQLHEETTSEEKLIEKEERKNLVNRYGMMKAFAAESDKSQHLLEKNIFEKLQENGHDMSNINIGQLMEVMKTINLQQKIEIFENEENNKKRSDYFISGLSYETNFENYLTRAEKKYINNDNYDRFDDENVQTIAENFEEVRMKYTEEKIRNKKYFELLKKYNDRQVKKKNRADISEIEKYGDVEKFRRL